MLLAEVSQIVGEAIQAKYKLPFTAAISYPEPQYGDYSTNAAFELARILKTAPQAIATELIGVIKHSDILSVDATAGFINVKMTEAYWIKQLQLAHAQPMPDMGKGSKVQVEFISANPTGPLTLANGRGGFSGDVLSRALERVGYAVEREYYVNDAGNQILALGKTLKGEEKLYAGEYITELATKVDLSQPALSVGKQGAVVMLEDIKTATVRMNIHFDRWFSEQSVIDSKLVDQVLDVLKEADATFEEDGALWLATTRHGDDKDRVLRKADGELTYLASDIAHYYQTYVDYGFDHKINFLGADHHGYVGRMQAAVAILSEAKGFKAQSTILIIQMVRLMQGGIEVRMSKRAGTYVTIDELLDEVGADVARFFFLMRSRDSQMEFDLDLAKERSQKNPLHYVMYSYARACSILEQAEARGLSPLSTISKLNGQEAALVRQMSRLPELLGQVARDYGVHRLAFYGIDLARLFHDLYESERIINLDRAVASKRLYLVVQYKRFMEEYFNILGITPVVKMGPPVI